MNTPQSVLEDEYMAKVRAETLERQIPARWYQKKDVQAFLDKHIKRIAKPGEIIHLAAVTEEDAEQIRAYQGVNVTGVADAILVANEDGSSEFTLDNIEGVVNTLLEIPNGAGIKEMWRRLLKPRSDFSEARPFSPPDI